MTAGPTNFDAQASKSGNENVRGAHAFHSFMPENVELSTVERLIDVPVLQLADVDGRSVDVHVVVLVGVSVSMIEGGWFAVGGLIQEVGFIWRVCRVTHVPSRTMMNLLSGRACSVEAFLLPGFTPTGGISAWE